ncbi:hypothetical protein H696_05957 [Fonticula alba]|uniref:EGF-like domain-containing protein n=1 Tax=Fonticula alba TaxID=691883 RepID=A0A058Z0K0_FONAL|nr:hypothetical protein H696_05957 [Fonticula alba]KCV67661.1 hypothetical protein H696_05957 [Fonticula alba]|eukprot:XP_009497999.1 hypothetical protein H696_05957 [Fonticula alba]
MAAVRAANCPEGFFSSGSEACQPCDPSCSQCASASSCLACQPGLVFLSTDPAVPSLCTATCQPGHYASHVGRCHACDFGCRDCRDNGFECYDCLPTFGWKETLFVGGSGKVGPCEECPPDCVTCSRDFGGFICHTCEPGFGLDEFGRCLAIAQRTGAWYDSSSGRFLSCAPTCETCVGPSPQECLTCVAGLTLEALPGSPVGSCAGACPPGRLPVPEIPGLCAACHESCSLCFGRSYGQCWACHAGHVLFHGRCLAACPTGYYPMGGRCELCHPSCGQCDGPLDSNCLGDCPGSMLTLAGPEDGKRRCVAQCPAGRTVWPDGTCAECGAHCDTCRFVEGPPDGPPVQCIKCAEGWLLDVATGECVAQCRPGSSRVGTECYQCSTGCADCLGTSGQQCVRCQDSHPLHLSDGCHATCPPGTYQSGGSCLACYALCGTCSGPGASQCTGCRDDNVLTMDGKCAGACPAGQFARRDTPQGPGVCQACGPMCDSCADGDWCFACQDGALLLEGTCRTGGCPEGSALCPDSERCISCGEGCGQCAGYSSGEQGTCRQRCTRCRDSLVLFPEEGVCRGSCSPRGILLDQAKAECAACRESCATCHEDVAWCTSCRHGDQWLMVATGRCEDACPESGHMRVISSGTGELAPGRMCFACPEGCAACSTSSDGSDVWASDAGSSNLRDAAECAISGKDGSLSCPWHVVCHRCRDPLLLLLEDGTCVASCPAGTFADRGREHVPVPACVRCQEGCAECTGRAEDQCLRQDRGKDSRGLVIGLGVGMGILALLLVGGLVVGFLVLRARKSSGSKAGPKGEILTLRGATPSIAGGRRSHRIVGLRRVRVGRLTMMRGRVRPYECHAWDGPGFVLDANSPLRSSI